MVEVWLFQISILEQIIGIRQVRIDDDAKDSMKFKKKT